MRFYYPPKRLTIIMPTSGQSNNKNGTFHIILKCKLYFYKLF